jgi:hypothetical protein
MSHTRPERIPRSASRFSGVTRVGLRVAAVAGIAGAAWVLSASAANAAETAAPNQAAPSSVLSLLDATLSNGREDSGTPSVTDAVSTTTAPIIGLTSNLLSGVLAPTNTVLSKGTAAPATTPSANRNNATDGSRPTAGAPTTRRANDVVFGAVANQAAASQPGASDVSRNGAAYVASADLVRTVDDVVAPLGLTDLVRTPLRVLQPMIGIADPVLAPLSPVLSPVTSAARWLAVPVANTLGTVARPVIAVVMRSTVDAVTPAVAPAVDSQPAPTSLISSAEVAPSVDAATIAMTPVRVEAGTSAQRAYDRAGIRGTPAPRHRIHGVDRRDLPPDPSPLPALPGSDLGAVSTLSSGSHEGSGAAAILSNPVAGDQVARHRFRTMADSTVRRLYVEDPTVSPD